MEVVGFRSIPKDLKLITSQKNIPLLDLTPSLDNHDVYRQFIQVLISTKQGAILSLGSAFRSDQGIFVVYLNHQSRPRLLGFVFVTESLNLLKRG